MSSNWRVKEKLGHVVQLMFAFGVNVTLDGSIADTTINMICNPTY